MNINGKDVVLRVDWTLGRVMCWENGITVFSSECYYVTVDWTKQEYNLTDEQLMFLCREYKDELDY